MSAQSQTTAHATHAEHHAPSLPVVTDEAGDTPGWVPALGVGLLALLGLLLAARLALRDAEPPAAPSEDTIAAAAAEAPAPPAPAAPAPAAQPEAQGEP